MHINWGHKDYPRIRYIQHRALRYFLGVGKVCPIGGLFGKTGWIPFRACTKFEILKLWHRIMSMSSDRLTRKIFLWSKSLSDTGVDNWTARTVHSLHCLIEEGYLGDGHTLKDILNAVMEEEFVAWRSTMDEIAWSSEIEGQLCFYRMLSTASVPKSYASHSFLNHLPAFQNQELIFTKKWLTCVIKKLSIFMHQPLSTSHFVLWIFVQHMPLQENIIICKMFHLRKC